MVFVFHWLLLSQALGAATPVGGNDEAPRQVLAESPQEQAEEKSTLLFSLGLNRSWTSRSDIRFQDEGYDFTLFDLSSRDDFIFSDRPDRTQYILRLIYYLNEQVFIGIAMNHMKYDIEPQEAKVVGSISPEVSQQYAGTYDEVMSIGHEGDMVETYDHTDGVNYSDVQIGLTHDLGISSENKHRLTLSGAFSLGGMIPRTKVIALGEDVNQPYQLAGYGMGVSGILRYHYLHWLFVDLALKGGWLNYTNARSFEAQGHTYHSYWFLEPMISAGVPFQL